MNFDINAARSAGYSDNEIADFLAKENNFDLDGALSSGYTPQEVVGFLAGSGSSGSGITMPESVTDTGDETARLAARYKAPAEEPSFLRSTAKTLGDAMGSVPGGIGLIGKTISGLAAPTPAAPAPSAAPAPAQAAPYKSRTEALDDAVNLLEEGYDRDKVTQSFSGAGIKWGEIVAHGQARGSDYFKQQPISEAQREVDRLAARYPSGAPTTTGEMRPWEPTAMEGLSNLVTRGVETGGRTVDVLRNRAGLAMPDDLLADRIAQRQRRIEAARPGSELQAGMEAIGDAGEKGFGPALQAIGTNPRAALAMIAESVIATAPAAAASVGGFAINPVAGVGAGFAAGTAMEYGATVVDTMIDAGMNPSDPLSVARALANPELMKRAEDRGLKRGLTVGAFSAITAGIASRFAAPMLQAARQGQVGRAAGLAGSAAGVGIVGDSAGEAAAQRVVGDPFNYSDILIEGLAGGPGAIAEVGGATIEAARNAPRQQLGVVSFTPADAPTKLAGLPDIVVPIPAQGDPNAGATGSVLPPTAERGGQPGGVGGTGVEPAVADGLGAIGDVRPGSDRVAAVDGTAGAVGDAGTQRPAPVTGDPLKRASDTDLLARAEAAAAPEGKVLADKPWLGRSGIGFATEKDAAVSLVSRVNRNPAWDWRIEQLPNGRYQLAGYTQAPTAQTLPPDVEWSFNPNNAIPPKKFAELMRGRELTGLEFVKDPNTALKTAQKITFAPGQMGAVKLGDRVWLNRDFSMEEMDDGTTVFTRAAAPAAAPAVARGVGQRGAPTAPSASQQKIVMSSLNRGGDKPQFVAVGSNTEHSGIAQRIAAAFGRPIMFVKHLANNAGFNALYYPDMGVIVANAEGRRPMYAAVTHEVLHSLPAELRARVVNDVMATVTPAQRARFLSEFKTYRNLDPKMQDEELVARIIEQDAENPQFWQKLADRMGDSEFAKLAREILAMLDRLLAGFDRENSSEFTSDIERVREVVADAYAEAQARLGEDTTVPGEAMASGDRLVKASKEEGATARGIVSSKPGRSFSVDGKSLQIVKYPKAKDLEFVTSRLHARVRSVLSSSGAQQFLTSAMGLAPKSIKLGEIRGLWAGEREDTFVIRAKTADGKDLSFDQTRSLSNMLGFGFIQEGAVTLSPSYNQNSDIDQIASLLIGKPDGSQLTRAEIDAALGEANKAGFFGASEALSGRGVKFLFFADSDSALSDEQQFADFLANVQKVQQATGLTDAVDFNTRSKLDEAKDYWVNATGARLDQGATASSGDAVGAEGPLDLFRGAVDHVLAPYIAELGVEGFSFDFKNWQRVFGATNAQVGYLRLKVAELEAVNKHGVVPKLRQKVSIANAKDVGASASMMLKTTESNARDQLDALDAVIAASRDAVKNTDAWLRMQARAYGTSDVPMAPNRFIQMYNGDGIYEQLKSLAPGQVADADHGFEAGQEFRRLYESGQVKPATTAKLMLWSFLSRGVSPYVQESAFLDLVDQVDPFVQKVVAGTFSDKDADAWTSIVSNTIRKGTGQPGAGTTHNANAFATSFMRGMAQAMPDGRTKMQYMHDLFSDPTKSGREIRREFVKISEGVGIDNKVISFTMLVIGHDDVAVLDRVQISNTFDDGRLGDYNLYDGVSRYGYLDAAGKNVWVGPGEESRAKAIELGGEENLVSALLPGSGMANLTTGVRGLMLYEPMEIALDAKLPAIYDRLKAEGLRSDSVRPTAGRWHWESWVAHSGQEASHKTLEALLNEVKGVPNPFADVSAKEGEYGAYSYATEYAVSKDGAKYKLYPDSAGVSHRLTLDGYKAFMADIKNPKNGVVPRGFKVSQNADGTGRSTPWWSDPRVDRAKLDELIAKHKEGGEPVASADRTAGRLDGIEAYHYSKASRTSLSSSSFGTGLQGSARDEYLNATDKRRRQRISFYVNKGTGIRPEAGVGGMAHRATLNNIYDANSDPLNLRKGGQAAFETAVLDNGFDGYLDRMEGTQPGQVILLGQRSVDVTPIGPRTVINDAKQVPGAAPRKEGSRTAGNEVVLRVPGDQMMGVINAQRTVKEAAPSFRLQYGEARVLTDEREAADAAFEGTGAAFRFGEPMFSAQRDQTNTPEFRAWFGNSKVVDADGKPLVVYHGTTGDFNEFSRVDGGNAYGAGYYFTKSPEEASGYALGTAGGRIAPSGDAAPNVMPVYLKMEKPFAFDARSLTKAEISAIEKAANKIRPGAFRSGELATAFDRAYPASARNVAQFVREQTGAEYSAILAEAGYDGLDTPMGMVVFKPTQIKSATGNTGAFDPTNPDIRASAQRNLPIKGQRFTLPETGRTDATRIKLQDDALRMRRVIEAVQAGGGIVNEEQNFYDANTLMPGRVQAMMDQFRDEVIKPMLEKAAKAKIDMEELSLYAYAKHAEERNDYIASINPRMPDGGSGMMTADANKILADIAASGKQADYDALHADLMSITETTRRVLLDEGLITQDQYDAMVNQYPSGNYIPLRGFENVDAETGAIRPGIGRGINVRGKETIKALGRASRAGDLIENVIRDYERAVVRSEKNNVAKVLLDFVLSNPDSDLWGVDVDKTATSFNKALGIVQYTKAINKGEDTIGVKVGGQQVYIKLADKALTRALRQSFKEETSSLERAAVVVSGWYTTLMRNVLTRYNPPFAMVNAIRDAQSGLLAATDELGAKGAAKFSAHLPKAIAATTADETGWKSLSNPLTQQYLREFKAAGALTGGFYMRNLEDIAGDLRNDLLKAGAAPRTVGEKLKFNIATKGVYLASTKFLRALELAGAASENATRLALYMAARDMGKTPAQAALLAKNGTTNFNRKGEWGGALNAAYLFFNAAVQGNAQLIKTLKNPKVLAGMSAFAGATMALAFYGAAMGGEDDDGEKYWDKIPSYEKERNLIIMLAPGDTIGRGIDRVGKRGRYIKIPVQYGINFFPNMGYAASDVIRNAADPRQGKTIGKAGMHLASVFFGSMNPFGGALDLTDSVSVAMAAAPTIIDPLIQLGTERNSFGAPTAPSKMPGDNKPDSERMFVSQMGGVPEWLAKSLNELGGGNEQKPGKILGVETSVTPGTIKTVIAATTGGLGTFFDQLFTAGSGMATPGKDIKASNIPFLNKMYGEVEEGVNIRSANERMREVRETVKLVEDQVKVGIDPEMDSDEKRLVSISSAQKLFDKESSRLRKEEIAIMRSPGMTDEQKLLARQNIQAARDRMAAAVNKVYLDSLIRKEGPER